VVQNHEILARFVPEKDLDPDTNEVKASLFEKATQNGMSVARLELARAAGSFQRQSDDKFRGFVIARCQDIRATMHDGKRLFCVHDTALPDNINHADVCGTVGVTGATAIKLRRELQEVFTRVMSQFEFPEPDSDMRSTPG
jgi:hypothetical protein